MRNEMIDITDTGFKPFPRAQEIRREASVSPDADWQSFAQELRGTEGNGDEEESILSGLVHGVDHSRRYVDAALTRLGDNLDAASMTKVTRAMSRYDLQTLMLSKITTKVSQAVDRLTSLQ